MITQTIRIRAVFPPSDPDAVTILRLVAAANDLGMLFRMLQAAALEQTSPYGKTIAMGVRHYILRMSTIHLPDVWKLINHPDFERAISRLVVHVPQIREWSSELKAALNRDPLRKIATAVRNEFAGHHDVQALAQALASVDDSLMDVPVGRTGARGLHFNVTDILFDIHLFELSHPRYGKNPRYISATAEDSFRLAIEEILDAHVALTTLAPALVAAMYMENVR